jgi:hypothetical protein
VRLSQALGNSLPRTVDVRSLLEDEKDPREPGDGLRANVLEEGHAVEQVLLHRDGDQLLDLGRGEPECLGLNLDGRRSELGQNVDRHVADLHDAEDHGCCCDRDDDASEPQARLDDPAHHRRVPRVRKTAANQAKCGLERFCR